MFKNIVKIVVSIIFLIWFFGSIYLIFINQDNINLLLVLFGQVFFIIGITFFIKTEDIINNLLLIIFPIIGFVLIMLGSLKNRFDFDGISGYFISLLFIIVGIIILFCTKLYNKKLRKNCTEKVYGKIVDLDYHYSDEGYSKLYSPIYEINYLGKVIRLLPPKEYTNIDKFNIGRIDELLINPSNLNEFIYPHKYSISFMYIFAILCIVSGLLPIILSVI